MIWLLSAGLLNLSRFDLMTIDSLRNLLILATPSHLLIFQDTGTAAFAFRSSLPLPGIIRDLRLAGDTLYAGTFHDAGCTVQAVDLGTPLYPAPLWSRDLYASVPAARVRIRKVHDTLYVGCGSSVVALNAGTGSPYPGMVVTLADSEVVMDLEIHPDSPYVWIGTNQCLLLASRDFSTLTDLLSYSAHPLVFYPDSQWLVVGSWWNLLTVLDVTSPSAPTIRLDRDTLVDWWHWVPHPLRFRRFGSQIASGPYRFSLDSLPPSVTVNPRGARMSWFDQGAWMFLFASDLHYQEVLVLPAWTAFKAVQVSRSEGYGLFAFPDTDRVVSPPDTDSVVVGYATFHPESLNPRGAVFQKIYAPLRETFQAFLHPPYAGVLVGSRTSPYLHLFQVGPDGMVETWTRRFTGAYRVIGDTSLILVLRTTYLNVVDPDPPGIVGAASPPCDTAADAVWAAPYAYFLCGDTLKAYDLSDPTAPAPAGAWALPAIGKHMVQDGRWMAILLEGNQVQVVDLNTPLNPVFANVFPLPFSPGTMALSGTRLFLSADPPRLEIFRIPDGTWLHAQPLTEETRRSQSLLPTSAGILAVYPDHLRFVALPSTSVAEAFPENQRNLPVRLLPGGIRIVQRGPFRVVDALGRVRFQGEVRGVKVLRLPRGIYTVVFPHHRSVRVVIP